MKLLVGLGNPGDAYKGTRHNVGFETISKLAFDFNIAMKNNRRFRAEVGEGRIGRVPVMLVKPTTYMNLSGEAVRALLDYYKLPPSEMIVVYDDISLPVGDIRVREQGSANGQKGIVNIISHLGTDEFSRIKIGIGDKPPSWKLSDYVLSRFLKEEFEDMIKGITKAGNAAEMILNEGITPAMNVFNKRLTKKPLLEAPQEKSAGGDKA